MGNIDCKCFKIKFINSFILIKYLSFSILFLFFVSISNAQTLCNGHSHNDYLQKKPLETAINHGFYSVEADVFIKKGKLVLAHTKFGKIKNKTLEDYYLKPLFELYKSHDNSKIYENSDRTLYLFIDIKSDANSSIKILEKEIEKYKPMFTYYENNDLHQKAVTIIISGKRDKNYISSIPKKRYFFIDGRLADIDKEFDTNLYPIISDNYKKAMKKIGEENIKKLIYKSLNQNKQIRFWNVKNNEKNWKKLNELGVSLINVDDIEQYSKFHNYFCR
jgi:hypothetical protein